MKYCSFCRQREGLYCGGCDKYTCSVCHLAEPHKSKCPPTRRQYGEPLMSRRPLPRKVTDSPTVVPSHPGVLGVLGDREGWDAAPGGNGWMHKGYGITVRQLSTYAYEVETKNGTRGATSATGALCIIDQVIAGAQAAV